MNYKYILDLKIKFDIFGDMYYDAYTDIYDSFEKAKYTGIEKIKYLRKKYKNITGIKIKDIIFNKNIIVDFVIMKIALNDKIKYNKNDIIKYKSKKSLYDYLMKITEVQYIKLDYTGYPGLITNNDFNEKLLCFKSFEYNKKYHLDKFKIGDKVKVKVPFEYFGYDKVYEIFDIINKDKSIYDSDDPLYFKQGYALTDIQNEYCNKYTQLHFDEDLIESSDEEYDKFYKEFE